MPSEPTDPPVVRVSNVERYAVVDVLRRHTSDGRLTLDEFSDRVEVALAAKTQTELAAVTADLPVITPDPLPAPPARGRSTRTVLALMTGNHRKGRWRTGRRVQAIAIMGGIELDLRQAEIQGPELVIVAIALMGSITVTVPEGFDVELTGLPIMGGKHLKVADVPLIPGSPPVRVRAFPVMGGVYVRSRGNRRGRLRRSLTSAGP